MKNRDIWQPSKFVYKNGKLIASRHKKEVNIASRLIADIVAEFYDKNIKKYASGKLLDLGSGKVPLYQVYREYISDSICVDWQNTQHPNDYLDLECDLEKGLPFAIGEFNTIILSDVLEHIPNPEMLWTEMSRILSPNGKIIMNVPFYYKIHEQPYDFYRFTEFALRRFVKMSGLRIIKLESIGGFPEIIGDIFAKNIMVLPIFGENLANFIQFLTKVFVRTALGKILSKKTKNIFPFGYFLIVEKSG